MLKLTLADIIFAAGGPNMSSLCYNCLEETFAGACERFLGYIFWNCYSAQTCRLNRYHPE